MSALYPAVSPGANAAPLFSWVNAAADPDLVTVSASHALPTLPASNLTTEFLGEPWQTPAGTGACSISWNYNGALRTYSVFQLERFVPPSWDCNYALELFSNVTPGLGELVYSSSPLFAWAPFLPPASPAIWGTAEFWPRLSDAELSALRHRFVHATWAADGERVAPRQHRSGRIVMTPPPDAGLLPNPWRASHLWIGEALQLERGDHDWDPRQVAVGGTLEDGPAGQRRAADRSWRMEHNLTFNAFESDWERLLVGQRLAADEHPFLMWLHPGRGVEARMLGGLFQHQAEISRRDLRAFDNALRRIYAVGLSLREFL